jgi:hypothetical protein
MNKILFIMTAILVFTGCDYVLAPSQQPISTTCPCKDPIYNQVYREVEDTMNILPSVILERDRNIIREQLIKSHLDDMGINDSTISKTQMKARFDAIALYYNRFKLCPKTINSGSFGSNWYVNIEGANDDKWTYDTVYPNIITEVK